MNKNQFFIVGAQRSGTTYLYQILDEHPQICMAKPLKPEPKYFLNTKLIDINIDEYYRRYYCTNRTIKTYGEKSTSYYESEEVAQKIASTFPLAKIIFILANPVDRAISNYKFSVQNGLETRTLEEVFIENKPINIAKYSTSVNPFAYKERGVYHKYLEYYFKYFPKENIKIIIRESFTGNKSAIQNLYQFLGCDSSFEPYSLSKVFNKSEKNFTLEDEIAVKKELHKYYEEDNFILENKYNLDITQWKNIC